MPLNPRIILALSHHAAGQRVVFEARVRESESVGFIKREAPSHITDWLREKGLLPEIPGTITLSRDQSDELLTYLKSAKALGATALRGGVRTAMAQLIPAVPYRPNKEALDQAVRDYGIVIV